MTERNEYKRWLEHGVFTDELQSIADDEEEIVSRFWKHLSFGTGGLRGIIGAGTNRMNEFVIRRATQGLADYARECGGLAKAVCIAYDTRNMSREFAEYAAETLCANRIKVYMFSSTRPTPMLSYAVREKRAFAGICITASHNPREYNGYKVYGSDGGQITDEAAEIISTRINSYNILAERSQMPLDFARENRLLINLDMVDDSYYEKVRALVTRKELVAENAAKLGILYTPLHGSGNLPVRRALSELGFTNLAVVPEQELPDGNFPTVPYPNPEEPETFRLALEQAQNQDIILATDPDCDRIGVQVRLSHSNEFAPLSGNQIGALLADYLISAKKEINAMPRNPAIIKTIVTTELARAICEANGIKLIETLTGFKYIGEKIGEWEKNRKHSFLFGFEESYGYLAGNFVRDKDAVIAAVLIAEMTLFYKLQNMTLHCALAELHKKYGYTSEKLISAALDGADGMEKMSAIMTKFRAFEGAEKVEDYCTGLHGLPKSDVVKLIFADKSWLAVRPSGTEPKIKFYLGGTSEERLQELEELVQSYL
jgi:phosphoglucomutase